MGLHFHEWIDCNAVAFSIELLQEVAFFEDLGDKKILTSRDLKMERLMVKSRYHSTFS